MNKKITVKGAVQGVGYRPFIAEKATEYGLVGNVKNIGAAVEIYVSGDDAAIASFVCCIEKEMPQGAFVLSVKVDDSEKDISNESCFTIIDSTEIDLSSELPVFLPDIGICEECTKELLDKNDRRYRYPLISCAICGPRFSITDRLPYDRQTTTMSAFEMCPDCSREYGSGRRHYAQTISCHSCGPQMKYLQNKGENAPVLDREDAVSAAAKDLKEGGIIALKGISGYQLICKPESVPAKMLREIKGRENKPFAIMFSTTEHANEYAYVSPKESKLLNSLARPIVLLKKKHDFPEEVDKNSRYIGAFLPSAGIHRLLCDEVGPLIVTSGNISDEPIIYKDEDVLEKLQGLSGVLYHDRAINLGQDDSVVFVVSCENGEYAQFVRRTRGYAPLPFVIDGHEEFEKVSECIMACGGDLKSTISFAKKDKILTTHYIADLKNELSSIGYYRSVAEIYKQLFSINPDVIVSDLHPGYVSSFVADKLSGEQLKLQHHYAHIYSVMAENGLNEAIGAAFDGTGYGLDRAIWGGEFIQINRQTPVRCGHLSYVKLVGGDEAAKNANQTMNCYIAQCLDQGLLYAEIVKKTPELKMLSAAQKAGAGAFDSSSMGRLFDAVSALLGICNYNSYEGECAISLEKAAWEYLDEHPEGCDTCPSFEMSFAKANDGLVFDQLSLFRDIYLCYNTKEIDTGEISLGFHLAIIKAIVSAFEALREQSGINTVCLSGGVFNNRIILSKSIDALKKRGFEVYWNQKVPLGDGGISLGQAYYAMLLKSAEHDVN